MSGFGNTGGPLQELVTPGEYISGTNYGTTELTDGQVVCRDVSQTNLTRLLAGIATPSSTNRQWPLGILECPGVTVGNLQDGRVCTRGVTKARVVIPANVALAVGDVLVHVPGQNYLQPYNVIASAAGTDRTVFNGFKPFAIAREARASSTSAQTIRGLTVELVGLGVRDPVVFRDLLRGTLTADVPTNPTTSFVPLGTVTHRGRIVGAHAFAAIGPVDATDAVNYVLRVAKVPRSAALFGGAVQVFSTNPQIGGAAASQQPASGFSTLFDYVATNATNGVIDAANANVEPGDRLFYSIDISRVTPDTEAANLAVEVFVMPDH